jgi:hypothetical protein
MKTSLLFSMLLFVTISKCLAQTDDIICNPYKLMNYYNANNIKFRASAEEQIGMGTDQSGVITHAKKTLEVVLPKKASNWKIYPYYQSTNPCTLTGANRQLGDLREVCWAQRSEQLAWGSIGQPTVRMNNDATVSIKVEFDNESNCDPRIIRLIVTYID